MVYGIAKTLLPLIALLAMFGNSVSAVSQIVELDFSSTQAITANHDVLIEFSGFSGGGSNFYCRAGFVDASNDAILDEWDVACSLGSIRVLVPDYPSLSTPITSVKPFARALVSNVWSLFTVGSASYTVQSNFYELVPYEYPVEVPALMAAFYISSRDYYTDIYMLPYGGDVWVDGNPTVLTADMDLLIHFTGVESYDPIRIELIPDEGSPIAYYTHGYQQFAVFKKQQLPYSASGYIKLTVLDPNTLEDVFYFTSENSMEFEQDSNCCSKRDLLDSFEINSPTPVMLVERGEQREFHEHKRTHDLWKKFHAEKKREEHEKRKKIDV